jgi:uncharacterized delta-60 repeat protein
MKTQYSKNSSLSVFALILSLLAAPAISVREITASPKISAAGRTSSTASLTAPGDLDPTFSGDGKLLDGVLSNGDDHGEGVAVQADGKIVVAGSVCGGSGCTFALARYNQNGSLDATFDSDGKVTTEIGQRSAASSVSIQTDGKIVAAGSSYNGSDDDLALARYNADGSLDTTFDIDGKVTTPIGTLDDIADVVAIQPDGKIVAAGYSNNGPIYVFAIVRYNTDGSPDTTFDSDGKVTTSIGLSSAFAHDVAIQQDGKIVAAGSSYNGSNDEFALVRYNPDGSLDTTFDGDGKVTTTVAPNGSDANAVAIGPDGKIVAAGRSISPQTGYDFALARYNPDGSLDETFDGDGKVIPFDGSGNDYADDVAIEPDGKIVAAGHRFQTATGYDFKLVRFNTNGSLDTTFDGDGNVVTDFGQPLDIVNAIAIQPDGRIVAAGSSANVNWDFALARYSQNGSLDTTFDSDGRVTSWIGVIVGNELFDVAVQPDGKIVAGGTALARYNDDGSFDTTFGTKGKVAASVSAVAIESDGKILTTGESRVSRYNPDGSPDPSFGTNGSVIIGDHLSAVSIQADGKIVAAGHVCFAYDEDGNCISNAFELIRVNQDGSADVAFDGDGKVTTLIGSNSMSWAVGIQDNGKIVAVGSSSDESNGGFALARYNPDGSLDTSFDNDGIVTTTMGTTSAYSVVISTNGKILVSGYGSDSFALARYNPDGSLDTSFDNDGIVTTQIGTFAIATSVAIQSDGKVLAAGTSSDTVPMGDFALVRYNPNGSLDTTFGGGDGTTTVDFNNSNDSAGGMALDGQGHVVVVGSSGGAFALARFVLGPLAPPVSISGRVTTPNGLGLRNTIVSIIDPIDGRRTVLTSSLGYYTFDSVTTGQMYTIGVQSKRYRFSSNQLQVDTALTGVDFTGIE